MAKQNEAIENKESVLGSLAEVVAEVKSALSHADLGPVPSTTSPTTRVYLRLPVISMTWPNLSLNSFVAWELPCCIFRLLNVGQKRSCRTLTVRLINRLITLEHYVYEGKLGR